ncbi:hypothetical protein [Chryseobacterium oryzae]|uniref:Uncharacterized protein n=1 Tax=Chryseobacterium oryzae TaxID=2929799 RepID=A0ABY4BG26_9FLAO|nr:hypothetical protein [Chryseobacterium oryzae]UOE38010.1 hypothetical protein MTP08_13300 [Chryseobacterium oryzae]
MLFYKYIINFICLFIPAKNRRKRRSELLLLPYIFGKNLKSRTGYKKFSSHKVTQKSILIVEPNPYHFEILPGFCKYFQDLGYNVDVIAQPDLKEDSPFIHYPHLPTVFYLSPKYQKKALSQSKIRDYDFVFLSTSVLWADNIRDSYINWLGFEPKGKYGFFMVEHNVIPYVKDYGHEKYVNQNRIFTLASQYSIPMFNPHYFGEINIKNKSPKTVFSTIIKEKQNIKLLLETCTKLVKNGYNNFEIIVTGRTSITEIPDDLQSFIKFTGKTTFTELWKVYRSSDFIIPMLNPEIAGHQRYRDGTITGSWQTMLGFAKPLVIHSQFSETYRLNVSNAIIFNENSELSTALQTCINMKNDAYLKLQENIKFLSDQIYKESLENLKFGINTNSSAQQ